MKILFFTGKGGVGKSTLAAAAASSAARLSLAETVLTPANSSRNRASGS